MVSTPLETGCSCGAGDQLDAERRRLAAAADSVGEMSDRLLRREAELEQRVQRLEASLQQEATVRSEMQERRASIHSRAQALDRSMREAAERERALARRESASQEQSQRMSSLDQEARAMEEAVAEEELALMEERNAIEAELEQSRQNWSNLEAEVQAAQRMMQEIARQAAEVDQECRALAGDEHLLSEIEDQVEPIRRSLAERERQLEESEAVLAARQADCDEREATILPEYRHCLEILDMLEQRAHELHAREEESERQRKRLLQRQRDLGGAEVRLSGLEGAVQRKSRSLHGQLQSDGVRDVDEMRERLSRLRSSEADWEERVRLQQAEIQQLESQVQQVELRGIHKKLVGVH